MIGRWTVVNGLLLAFVALLGMQVSRTWMRAVPPLHMPSTGGAEERPHRDPKVKPVARNDRAEQTEQLVASITSQDLFDSSRQAPGVGGQPTVVEVPPPTGIELVGIRLLGGDQEAFIRDASQQNAQRRVRTGDDIAGYTVQSINPTNVELGNATGQSVTLYLQLSPSAGPKPGGQVAPRPGTPTPVPVRAAVAAGVQTPAAAGVQPPPASVMDPAAAERQRRRQERLRQRGGMQPNLPAGVRQQRDQMQKGA